MKTYTTEQLKLAVKESFSLAEVIRKLNLIAAGSNYENIKHAIKLENLDISHFTGQGHLKGKTHNWAKKLKLEEILVENKLYNSNRLRKRLIREGYFQCKCDSCGLSEWLNKPIPLELDHKNGIKSDNRIENLRLLCPNCHAFTNNYRGKNKKRHRRPTAESHHLPNGDGIFESEEREYYLNEGCKAIKEHLDAAGPKLFEFISNEDI